MRLAQQAMALQTAQELRRRPSHNQQQGAPDDRKPRPQVPDKPIRQGKTRPELRVAPLLSRIGSKIAARVVPAKYERAAEGVGNEEFVFTGTCDATVELTENTAGPAAVHIIGISASRYFSVRAVGTEDDPVRTLRPYQGVRSLDWSGGESTGFEVRATGSWKIEVLPLSAIPNFNISFKGDGDMVVHFTGDGSLVEIAGNEARRFF
jgi:hypothetical protein